MLLLAAALPVQAQSVHVISWPAFSDRGPNLAGPPDSRYVGVSPADDATVAKFDCGTMYANLAAFLGVGVDTLTRTDVIAFEGNGGHPGESGGWESSRWVFTDGRRSLTVVADAVLGTSDPPGVVLANASIASDAYERYFGLPPDPTNKVISFMLFDLPSAIDTDRRSFQITVEGFASGEGTPDPDAIGVFSRSCHCAPKRVGKDCSVD